MRHAHGRPLLQLLSVMVVLGALPSVTLLGYLDTEVLLSSVKVEVVPVI